MALNRGAGCGWVLAGLFGLILLGQCVSGETTDQKGGEADEALTGAQGFASLPGAEEVAREERRQPIDRLYVQPTTANCRKAPAASSQAIRRIERNDYVSVMEATGGWSRLDSGCWVRSDLLGPYRRYIEPAPEPRTAYSGSVGRSSSGYYRNCSAARAAGAAPIRRGDPGYSRRLDRDGDGVACE